MVRRDDFDHVRFALEEEGFVYRHVAALDVFLDNEDASIRDAVHFIFTDGQARIQEPVTNHLLETSRNTGEFNVISLEALVQIKLTAFRDKDRTHLRDLIEVGLIDPSWLSKLPTELATRLQSILENPEG